MPLFNPLGGAAPLASPTFTGDVTAPNLRLTTVDPSGARFAFQAATGTFETGLYSDTTANWGYNVSSTPGVKAVAGEPMMFWQIESKFRNDSGSPYGSELHFNFARPTDASGIYNRPINCFMEHVSGLTTVAVAGGFSIGYSNGALNRYLFPESGTPWHYDGAGLILTTVASNAGARASEIALIPDVQFPSFAFRNGATIAASIDADLVAQDLTVIAKGGFFVRNTVAAKVGLTVRAAAAQSVDVVQFIAPDAFTVTSRINKNGYYVIAKTSAPADAELAAGEVALWLDATNGAAKLKIKAKQADGTVRSGEVALA